MTKSKDTTFSFSVTMQLLSNLLSKRTIRNLHLVSKDPYDFLPWPKQLDFIITQLKEKWTTTNQPPFSFTFTLFHLINIIILERKNTDSLLSSFENSMYLELIYIRFTILSMELLEKSFRHSSFVRKGGEYSLCSIIPYVSERDSGYRLRGRDYYTLTRFICH